MLVSRTYLAASVSVMLDGDLLHFVDHIPVVDAAFVPFASPFAPVPEPWQPRDLVSCVPTLLTERKENFVLMPPSVLVVEGKDLLIVLDATTKVLLTSFH